MNQAPYVRQRSRDNRLPGLVTATQVDTIPNPDVTTNWSFPGFPSGVDRVMTDIVTPGWERIKGNGGIVSNKMSSLENNHIFKPVSITDTLTHPVIDAGKVTVHYNGPYPSAFDVGEPPPLVAGGKYLALRYNQLDTGSAGKLAAQAAVAARIKVNPVLVQSIVSLAELHKTVRMVTDAARTLARLRTAIFRTGNVDQVFDLILGVRRGQAGRAGRFLTGASTRYLEYRYGWRILMMEIQSVIKALDKTVVRKSRATARSRMFSFHTSKDTISYVSAVTGTDVYDLTKTEDVKASAWVLYEADLNYQSSRDWGLAEVPLAAWELVPFSFVVDWFVPIGKWLEAITPKVGIKILSEGVTVTTTRVVTRLCVANIPSPSGSTRYARTGLVDSEDKLVTTSKERTPTMSGFLLRPYVDVKLDVARALDAIALLATAGRARGTSIRR